MSSKFLKQVKGMNKFHQIPTDQFVPISHDNSYLFTHFDKVSNFLAFNLGNNYKNVLAKPVQNGYFFDWFSVHVGLINVKDLSQLEAEAGLIRYWEFIDIIKAKIRELSDSGDEDKRNWASLLSKVFNQHNNYIFSNGKEISIVWGWKFNNNEIYKPSISNRTIIGFASDNNGDVSHKKQIDTKKDNEESITVKDATDHDSTVNEEEAFGISYGSEQVIVKTPQPMDENTTVQEHGFRGFLKWFAATYWWLLWVLPFLSAVVFFVKAYRLNY